MKQIIIPTDFSEGAWNAFLYATKLGEQLNAEELLLINSYQEPHSGAATLVSVEKIMRQDSESQLQLLLERIKRSGLAGSFKINEKSIHGGLVDVLNSLIGDSREQLVVMGTLGETGAIEKLLGSNASDVVAKVKCPILVIPPDTRFSQLEKIVLASDFEDLPKDTDFSLLSKIYRKNSPAPLDVVHVVNAGDEKVLTKVDYHTLLKGVAYADHEISGEDVADTLDNYVARTQPDMLVLIRKSRGLFRNIFHKSITKKLTLHAKIPLLILKTEE